MLTVPRFTAVHTSNRVHMVHKCQHLDLEVDAIHLELEVGAIYMVPGTLESNSRGREGRDVFHCNSITFP